MSELTHERCSELLEAYASGRLELRVREQVDLHLATCSDCSLELVAVGALRGPEVLPMSGAERDALSKGVRSAIFSPTNASFFERFGRRLAPALGAVALLALAALALVSLPRQSDEPASVPELSTEGGDGSGQLPGGDAMEADRAAEPKGASASKEEPEALSDDGATNSGQAVGGGAAGGAPAPAAGDVSAATAAGTALNARASFVVQEETFAETGLDVGSLVPTISPRDRFQYSRAVPGLAAAAPTRRLGELTRECADQTVSTSPHPLVPTSAAYYPDDVLVIGFVWLEESSSLLNYELRGWIGGRCDRISPIYRRGFIE